MSKLPSHLGQLEQLAAKRAAAKSNRRAVTIYLDRKLFEQLQKQSEVRGLSASQVIEASVRDVIAKWEDEKRR